MSPYRELGLELVRCHDVSYTYGSGATAVVAIHGVRCTVLAGKNLVITGPSGSGKSTLLHLMADLSQPTTGHLTWPGFEHDPVGRPWLVGVVFQGPSLIPALNVIENVALPLVLEGCSDRDAHQLAGDALGELDVADLREKLPEELSGGQAQRVAIARVLALRPPLILADEPTGQLDRNTSAHVMDVLLNAAQTLGATVVVSTHDPSLAERFDMRWQMRDGALTTDQLVTTDDYQRNLL